MITLPRRGEIKYFDTALERSTAERANSSSRKMRQQPSASPTFSTAADLALDAFRTRTGSNHVDRRAHSRGRLQVDTDATR